MFCSVASSPLRLPARSGGSSGRSQVSELIARPPVCSQSVSSAAAPARKEVKLQESIMSVCVCVLLSEGGGVGTPSFRRRHDRTHLPAKTEGLVGATLAQAGTNTARLTSPPPF